MTDDYISDLVKRGLEAAETIDNEFKTSHPFGTVEANTVRELARVLESYAL